MNVYHIKKRHEAISIANFLLKIWTHINYLSTHTIRGKCTTEKFSWKIALIEQKLPLKFILGFPNLLSNRFRSVII